MALLFSLMSTSIVEIAVSVPVLSTVLRSAGATTGVLLSDIDLGSGSGLSSGGSVKSYSDARLPSALSIQVTKPPERRKTSAAVFETASGVTFPARINSRRSLSRCC